MIFFFLFVRIRNVMDLNRDDFLNLDIFFFRGCFFSDFMNSEVNYINVSKEFFKFYGD